MVALWFVVIQFKKLNNSKIIYCDSIQKIIQFKIKMPIFTWYMKFNHNARQQALKSDLHLTSTDLLSDKIIWTTKKYALSRNNFFEACLQCILATMQCKQTIKSNSYWANLTIANSPRCSVRLWKYLTKENIHDICTMNDRTCLHVIDNLIITNYICGPVKSWTSSRYDIGLY